MAYGAGPNSENEPIIPPRIKKKKTSPKDKAIPIATKVGQKIRENGIFESVITCIYLLIKELNCTGKLNGFIRKVRRKDER